MHSRPCLFDKTHPRNLHTKAIHQNNSNDVLLMQVNGQRTHTWHADAVESTDLVEAGGVVLAGVRLALVDVHLTAWTFITLKTLALERAFSVETPSAMLTWVRT